MKRTISIALLILLLLSAAACDKTKDAAVGKWGAVSITSLGMTVGIGEAFDDGASLEFKANGKCTVNIDGDSAEGKWEVWDNGSLYISAGGEDFAAVIEDGVLILALPAYAMDINFEKK